MSLTFERTAAMRRLKDLDEPSLYGRLVDLRRQVADWLAYTPQTFPHYTRHTLAHSDEIVLQLSRMLFEDGDPSRPVVDLSAAEIFCLVAAALLHDAGMVTSDRERLEILGSPDWNAWVSDGTGATRWRELEQLRATATTEQEHFVADLQLRFLLADFVRRRHHVRAGDLIRHSEILFGTLALGDPALTRTIADVCEAHGLDWPSLHDTDRFPTRRDVEGGAVNVRLLAVLLRLGDLLDMSHDRACPLLLTAAAPIPADSLAHWSQYRRIVHRLTSPERIEITAECKNQEEHRVLADWCQWIEQEVSHAGLVLVDSRRHASWRPPVAQVGGVQATMHVRPAPGATYIPVDWSFEIDRDTVYERLVKDVYTDPLDFVRELVQNAADANRCAALGSTSARGGWPWGDATDAPQIKLTLSSVEVIDDMSGETETRISLSVEDEGIGMTAETVRRYLLQVGRSYYRSPEFQRKHGFIPTSRFGIGFLSVFSVSSDITIETLASEAQTPGAEPTPLRIKLTGPRSYILMEHGERSTPGTRVRVGLSSAISFEALVGKIRTWCRRLEFPVIVRDERTGDEATVTRERHEQFEFELAIETAAYDRVRRRAIPLLSPGARGEWYVDEVHERATQRWRWDISSFFLNQEIVAHDPRAQSLPKSLRPLFCMHGLDVRPDSIDTAWPSLRIDYRKSQEELPLSLDRRNWQSHDLLPADEGVSTAMLKTLEEHFAVYRADWRYRAATLRVVKLPLDVRRNVPKTTRLFDADGTPHLMSLADIAAHPHIWLVPEEVPDDSPLQCLPRSIAPSEVAMPAIDTYLWESNDMMQLLQVERAPLSVDLTSDGRYCMMLGPATVETWYYPATVLISRIEGAAESDFVVRLWGTFPSSQTCWVNPSNPVFAWLAELVPELREADPLLRIGFGGRSGETVVERVLGALALASADSFEPTQRLASLESLLSALHHSITGDENLPVMLTRSEHGLSGTLIH